MASNDFLATYTPLANDIAQQTGLNPAVVLGIIDIETGGGTRVKGNNLFGISPVINGRQVVASYPDASAAGQAFVSLMQTPRYSGVAKVPADQQPGALVASGYNTVNPNYARLVGGRAQTFSGQLGYQGGGPQTTAPTPDYNTPSRKPAPAQAQPQADPTLDLVNTELGSGSSAKPSAKPQDDPTKQQVTEELGAPSAPGLTGPPVKPEEPPKGTYTPEGIYIPPYGDTSANPTLKTLLGLPEKLTPEQQARVQSPTSLERVGSAVAEGYGGYQGTDTAKMVEKWAPGGVELGRYIVNPLAGGVSGLFRGGQQFVQEATPDVSLPALPPGVSIPLGGGRSLSGQLTPGSLGRELAAAPEAFPTGETGAAVRGPSTAAAARNALNRPITMQDIREAMSRIPPEEPPVGAGGNALNRPQDTTQAPPSVSPAVQQAAPGPTFLDRNWIQKAGEAEGGGYDMTKGGDALVAEAQQALDAGHTVELVTDGGRKTVPITDIKNGMLTDAQGQRWGDAWIANDATGREGLRITPRPAETPRAAPPELTEAEAPTPRSAGAAATPSGAAPEYTDVQRATNLRKSIDQPARERAGTALVDDTAYVTNVPGGQLPARMLPERNFDPQVALDHKRRYADSEGQAYRAQYDANETTRHNGMTDLLRQDAGDGNTLDALRTSRREVAPEQFGAFENERPVNVSSDVSYMQKLLDSPEGKRGAVERSVKSVLQRLYKRDGTLEDRPSQLYGARRHIDDLLNKAERPKDVEGSDAQVSQFILRDIANRLDERIQSGADNYQAYRDAYREASQPVNQQRFLQRYFEGAKNIVGSNGKLVLRKVEQMLEDIHKGLTDSKNTLAKSLTDEQIQNIVNVRNELAAKQLRDEQAKVAGSDSYQLFTAGAAKSPTVLGTVARHAAGGLAHSALAYTAYAANPLALAANAALGTFQATRPARVAAQAARAQQKVNELAAARDAELLSQHPLRQ